MLLNPLTYVIIDRLSTVEKSFSYFTRINFYKDVWHMFLNNPVWGVGLGNLGYYAKFVIIEHSSAHNIVLGLLGETGIPGAIIYISMLIIVILRFSRAFALKENESSKLFLWSFLSSLVGVYIHSMMEPNFEATMFSIIFWCAVAVFLRFSELTSEEKLVVFFSLKKESIL